MNKTGSEKTEKRTKLLTIILAVVLCFSTTAGTVAAFSATTVKDEAVAPVSGHEQMLYISDNDADDIPTDQELAEMGTVLDETGVSLMPAGFTFVEYTEPTPEPSPSPTASVSPEASEQVGYTPEDYAKLKPGTRADAVISLQERLMELDYLSNDEPTNYYGNQTAYAIQLFQYRNGLNANGVCNLETAKLLFSASAEKYMVSIGASGTDVTELQKRLKELGYMSSATGYFGKDTDTAVRAFQKNNGLTADGKVGEATREALYSDSAVPAGSSTATKTPAPTTNSGTTSSAPTPAPTPAADASAANPPNTAKAQEFINYAQTHLGKPYVLGGKGPDVFDCSGFIYHVLKYDMGYNFSYKTSAMWASSSYPTISRANLQPGDILCFNGHVGIYLGNDSMIDASSTDGKIRIAYNIWSKSYWVTNFKFGKRYFVA